MKAENSISILYNLTMHNITYKKFTSIKLTFITILFFITFQIRAQFPFFESFKDATAPRIEFGGTPRAFLTGGAGNKDGFNDQIGEGYLRLTNKANNQTGTVWSDLYAFPSAYGMTITFEYYTHGGNGADGLAFILFDATASPITAGAFGGSLGYAQQNSTSGFSKGYLGIGIDEYGGFSEKSEGKSGGLASRLTSSITLRGAGSGTTGYPHLTTVQTSTLSSPFNIAGNDRTATDDSKLGFRKVEIVLKKPATGSGFFIDVYLTHGGIKTLVIDNYQYTTVPPPNLKFAISSSTGGDNNFHEIRNLNLSVDLPTLFVPEANPVSFSGCAGLAAETPFDINSNNIGTVNTFGTINRNAIDLDPALDGIQSSKTVAGKGTFTYDAITGKVTFTPENTTVEGTVAIDYTFNDSYGKTSNISTITYSNLPPDTVNNSCLASLNTEVTSLTKSICNIPDEIVSYEVTISNTGTGMANDVHLHFLFPDGIEFYSATASYSENASGPIGSIISSMNKQDVARIGKFNIPINGKVTILLKGKTTTAILPGTYNVDAQADYNDPTQVNRIISPFINGLVNWFHYSTGEKVPGINFNGNLSSTDDIIVHALPILSIQNPAAVYSSDAVDLTATAIATKGNASDVLTYYSDAAATIPLPNPKTAGAGTYYIKSTTVAGCFVIKPVIVTANLLPSLITDVTSLTKSICNNPGEIVSYEVTITNTGSGKVNDADLFFIFPAGIIFDSATASYNGNATGPIGSIISSMNKQDVARIGKFNIPINGKVTILLKGKTTSSILPGIHHVDAEAEYNDPIQNRVITAFINGFAELKTYASGEKVAGINFNGNLSTTDDVTVAANTTDITTNGITICKGATGLLSATSATGIMPTPVTVFRGRWNSAIDPKSQMPGQRISDVPICEFYPDVFGTYKSISFSVNVSGTYSLEMTGESEYLRAGYIYKGNYALGTCPEDGTWITADDDYGIIGAKNPVLTAHLEVGTLYTLVSLIQTRDDANYTTDFTWTLCQTEIDVTITEPEKLIATSSDVVNVTCKGEANGSVVITPNGGTAPYNITPAQTDLSAGKHTFTITDNNKCQTEIEVTITEPEKLIATSSDVVNVTCKGEANGSVVITPKGGTAPYNITPAQTGLLAGKHTFTVTDNNKCQTEIDATISEPEKLIATSSDVINVTCQGEANGSVKITPNGGTAPYTITPEQTGLTAGKHTFTVTDNNKCQTEIDVTITEPEKLIATSSNVVNVTCKGEANGSVVINPNGGTAPYNITPAQTGLIAGKHTFTVTDGNKCETQIEVTISEPEKLIATASNVVNVACKGEANGSVVINPNGGTAPYNITPAQTGLIAGKHTFTVTDDNKCETQIEVTISEPEKLTATSSNVANVKCKGESNGSVIITPNGGTAPYNITPAQTGLAAGKYTFTVIDNNKCQTEIDVTITEPKALTATSSNVVNVKCKGDSNGSVVITPNGGTAPYSITPEQTGLTAGKHTFTITDSNNCTTTTNVTISEPAALTATSSNVVNVKCKGEANGSVDITPNGGTAPYTITPSQTNLAAGSHTFTVTDSNKCINEITVIINEPNVLEAKVLGAISPELCFGNQDGSFTIEISGGNKPYSYSLDEQNGSLPKGSADQTEFLFDNLSGGKHNVYIKDAKGCTTQIQVTLPDAIIINPVADIDTRCENNATSNSVTVTIDKSISNPNDVDYALDREDGVYQSENIFKNVASGNHIIYARHTNGCIQPTKEFTVNYIEPLTLTLADGELNEIVATATGGADQYRYSLNEEYNGATNKFPIYKSGIYTVTVTDQNGCSVTTSRYFEYIDVCIPNHFTPNGDGINDEWGPGCSINYTHLTFTVFDRYGRILGNYKYGQKWDGKYNGTELPTGDYWYVFKLNDNKDNREFVGHFTLYR